MKNQGTSRLLSRLGIKTSLTRTPLLDDILF